MISDARANMIRATARAESRERFLSMPIFDKAQRLAIARRITDGVFKETLNLLCFHVLLEIMQQRMVIEHFTFNEKEDLAEEEANKIIKDPDCRVHVLMMSNLD